MRSLPICFLALALTGILLTACASPSEDGSYTFDGEELSKAQVLVITDAAGTELETITEPDTLQALVDALRIEDWELTDLPENAQPKLVAALYQEPTETVLGKDGEELLHLCDLTVYEAGCYVSLGFDIAMLELNLDFLAPQGALDPWNAFAAS